MEPPAPKKTVAMRRRLLSKYLMILKSPSPSRTLSSKTLYLSSLDQNTVRVYTQVLLLFPFPDANHADAAITCLSRGLRETLKKFPFLAGKLRLVGAGKLALDYPLQVGDPVESCVFRRKNIPLSAQFPYTYQELKRAGMPPNAFQPDMFRPDDLLHYSGIPTNGEGMVDFTKSDAPALRIQANFIPGGLILSMYYHHAVMDCSGIQNFWKWYAHHVSSVSNFSQGILSDEPQGMSLPPLSTHQLALIMTKSSRISR